MSRHRPFTASADTRREIPGTDAARLDRIAAAIASLREEERRLARLGLDAAARRCREQRRYWEFLGAVFSLEPFESERRAA